MKERGEVCVGLLSDPNIRKFEARIDEIEEMCCFNCYYNSHRDSTRKEAGFPICFFHVHGEGEGECESVPSYYDDSEDDEEDDFPW